MFSEQIRNAEVFLVQSCWERGKDETTNCIYFYLFGVLDNQTFRQVIESTNCSMVKGGTTVTVVLRPEREAGSVFIYVVYLEPRYEIWLGGVK